MDNWKNSSNPAPHTGGKKPFDSPKRVKIVGNLPKGLQLPGGFPRSHLLPGPSPYLALCGSPES
jgi:hypothetical protein